MVVVYRGSNTNFEKQARTDKKSDIVTTNAVKSIKIDENCVSFTIETETPASPIKKRIRDDVIRTVSKIDGINKLEVTVNTKKRSHLAGGTPETLKDVDRIIAVASGKGGVGKSTTSVNLALALQQKGHSVGILDADIYGPSLSMMLNVTEAPKADMAGHIFPVEAKGLKAMSIAMFASDQMPLVWRGPMVSSMMSQLITTVEWGALDYLIVDMPPGTGDIQLTLTQQCPLSGVIIVTTPQDVALLDARKGLKMFEVVKVPVLGLIENMSYFVCDGCDKKHYIFGKSGGKKLKEQLGIPLIGEIPLEPALVSACDSGQPLIDFEKDQPLNSIFQKITTTIYNQLETWEKNEKNALFSFDKEWASLPVRAAEATPDDEIPENPVIQDIFKTADHKLAITWVDGVVSLFDSATVRDECCCANCKDEWSGDRLRTQGTADRATYPVRMNGVGRYAIRFEWSDGHDTGIYSLQNLRSMSEWHRRSN